MALAGYEIVATLKSGGMGEVLVARQLGAHGFERRVAIKRIRKELARQPGLRAMFLDEAKVIARINHPAVVHVYDFGEEDGGLYLVMELVEGLSLSELLQADVEFPASVAVAVVAEAARGLHSAHSLRDDDGRELRVVHRDISPHNILLTFDGQPKVIDFGIALARDRAAPATLPGLIRGKLRYLAPEQMAQESVDPRTDVYSLGIVLHELLTGQPLFTSKTMVERLKASGAIPSPSSIVDVSARLDPIVLRCLEPAVSQRYPDAQALADALDEVARSIDGPSPRAWAPKALGALREIHAARLRGLAEGTPSGPRGRVEGTQVDDPPAGPVAAQPTDPPAGPVAAQTTIAAPLVDELITTETSAHSSRGHRLLLVAPAVLFVIVLGLIGLSISGGGPAVVATPVAGEVEREDDEASRRAERAPPVGPTAGARAVDPSRSDRAPSPAAEGRLEAVGDDAQSVGAAAEARPLGPGAADPSAPHQRAAQSAGERSVNVESGARSASAAKDGSPAKSRRSRRRRGASEGSREARRGVVTGSGSTGRGPPGSSARVGAGDRTKAEPGTVTFGAKPYAQVKVDGVAIGVTPLIDHALAPGRHEIEFIDPASGARRWAKTISVEPGQHRSVIAPRQ